MDFDISMLVLGLPFDGSTLKTKSLGGSETAGLYMAKALARTGQHVRVFCNTQEQSQDEDGVEYFPAGLWQQFVRGTPHDVAIVQRAPDLFAVRTEARLNLLWQHDLALGRTSHTLNAVTWNVDKVMVVSDYMRKQYQEVTGLPDSVFYTTRNGIDFALADSVYAARGVRDKRFQQKRLIYSARAERGLDILLRDIMPLILERDPEVTLHVYGYHNPVTDLQAFYNECSVLATKLGEGVVTFHDPLTKEALYREYVQGGVYVYPTPSPVGPMFAEVSCISVMEAQACGLPVVTSARGALPETLAQDAGVLIEGDPWSKAYQAEFATAVLLFIHDQALWQKAVKAGRAKAESLAWDAVAQDWAQMFEREIRSKSSNPDRLVRHLWRQSDIVAIKHYVKELTDQATNEWQAANEWAAIINAWFFMDVPEGYRKQYEAIGATHDDFVYDAAPHEPRFALLEGWLKEQKITNVLDYGCAHGAYAINLAQNIPELFISGVDIDHNSVRMATEWAAKRGVQDRAAFSVWTHDSEHGVRDAMGGQFGAVLMQEVLEHVPEPWEVAERVEQQVERGGWVYITVPFGPWEYSSYHTYPHRCHIWHFDQHDLRDMFGKKPEFAVSSFYYSDSPELGTALGWWIVTYKADHKSVGKVNLDRKLWLQAPRQTVSASLILGGENSDQTLRWCLESIYHLADEVVVADCGMSPAARSILNDFSGSREYPKVTVFKGPNPLKEGFEVARNASLDRCRMDWVLWIDADEKLINPRIVQKYLRENRFNGYGIRQHHFACDTSFSPDMPVRLFRNREYQGKRARFIGAIHEHPELALNEGPGPVVVLSDAHIAHVGYLIENTRQRRFGRNRNLLLLDQQRYPERLIQKHFMMRDNIILVREALKLNGGVVDSEVRRLCQETIDLYHKYFAGEKRSFANADSVQYYSDALEVTGQGFWASIQVEVNKDGQPAGAPTMLRFANSTDLIAELTRRAKEKSERFDSIWW